jgi:hypothetical protein
VNFCGNESPRVNRPRICGGCGAPLLENGAMLVVKRSGLVGIVEAWYDAGEPRDLADPEIIAVFGTEACRSAWLVKFRNERILMHTRN